MKVALFFECTEVDIQLQCKGYVIIVSYPAYELEEESGEL